MVLSGTIVFAQKSKQNEKESLLNQSTASALSFRNIGPALTSGRIADIAVDPVDPNTWYVGAASGGVWKTKNHGTTFKPIFDHYDSYSVGCVEIAPSNRNTIWVGTGENNNQRSVSYGDGVYKSMDGGKSFKNMGLKASEHIGSIVIHPEDENVVIVGAYGPVWSSGGDRGIYKTTDGGKTWKQTLNISEHTGVSDIMMDPTNPNVLYAAAHQRRRREWTYIGGGPESAIYKSEDGGESWREVSKGLPKGQMGRIGLAVSPADHNYVYAIVEARDGKGGFFRSVNRGESWKKMSSYKTSGNYYQEIICDPLDRDKVFAMDTWLHHTEDGGKNFQMTGESKKHVDNHCIWINPQNTSHWIVGCDGGIYETYNHAKEWKYYANLPIIQFYKVAVDNSEPFYYVYGGTQDNNSMGGPSASINNAGILNSDWFITNGGDGFESAIDPVNPNIVYAQAQYGWLVRYDKQTGEKVAIQPQPKRGEAAYRWNWDAPLVISPHDHNTIYFAANRVFKSSNMGDDWATISPDLSQQIDRNKLAVMGQVWSQDAVMKNKSTSIYGNIVAMDESPKVKGLLYVGTDDGCVQVSENEGSSWTKYTSFPGIPENTRVNMMMASLHDENTVFACFNNQRSGDFKPYLMKSTNRGKSWTSISGNLPERGTVYCVRQDHVNPDLLFAGTEFGAYYTIDGGKKWYKLSGLPTISIYDLEIQKRENDLVAASFGRGFYVLDNYAPLREVNEETLNKKAHLFPVKEALLYVPSAPLGLRGTGSQGADLWAAENPAFGATFTIYLKETESGLKEERQKRESELEKDKKAVPYPSIEEMHKEAEDEAQKMVLVIRNGAGEEIKRLVTSPRKGMQRINWNLRHQTTSPIKLRTGPVGRYSDPDDGFLVTPGTYSVEVYLIRNGEVEQVIEKTSFKVRGLDNQVLPPSNVAELAALRKEVAEMSRVVSGGGKVLGEKSDKLDLMEHAIKHYPKADLNWLKDVREIRQEMKEAQIMLYGDGLVSSKEIETLPGLASRLGIVEYQLFSNMSRPTKSQKENLEMAREQYEAYRKLLVSLDGKMKVLENRLDQVPIPYTKGKGTSWKED